MKKIYFLLLPLALFLLNACSKESGPFTLGIDIQAEFTNDSVEIFVDNQKVLTGRFTTDWSTGYAGGRTTLTEPRGKHIIKIIVNSTTVLEENIRLVKNKYVGVVYNRQAGQILLNYYDKPLLYN